MHGYVLSRILDLPFLAPASCCLTAISPIQKLYRILVCKSGGLLSRWSMFNFHETVSGEITNSIVVCAAWLRIFRISFNMELYWRESLKEHPYNTLTNMKFMRCAYMYLVSMCVSRVFWCFTQVRISNVCFWGELVSKYFARNPEDVRDSPRTASDRS